MTHLRSLLCLLPLAVLTTSAQSPTVEVFGYRDFTQQAKWDAVFMAVPDAKLAGQHLKTLTSAPHWASSPEDYATAVYVADKFKEAGLQTEIVPYKVLLNKPVKILIEAFDSTGTKLMSGPTPEHVDPTKNGGDPYQDDPRILPAFNGSSPSGDITAEVIYANYGTLADFQQLAKLGISVKDKIVIVRYGENFRGIKTYIAQQYGAKGVLIYSDPADDGYFRGDVYPKGPWRPDSAVQRGSIQFLPIYPGDPTTPGIAATPDLPSAKRIPADKLQANQPSIPTNPLSYKDAAPILKALGGDESPREWQGALPFTYHLGASAKNANLARVTVHMHLEQDIALRTIWDVIGTIPGASPTQKDDWVVAGNHRDAWVYGAVDPNSGTAAMLETVHGLGELLKQGWKPERTIVIGSWDAEEEGLMGSTEWAEQHEKILAHAVAYFNTDVGVSGPNFNAAAVPSLKQFVREVTKEVPSPKGRHSLRPMEGRPGRSKQQHQPPQQTSRRRHRRTHRHARLRLRLHPLHPAPRCSLDRHRLRRPLRRLPLHLRRLCLVHQVRRPHLRLRAAAGPSLRTRSSPHGRHRRPPLRLRTLRQRGPRLPRRRPEARHRAEADPRLHCVPGRRQTFCCRRHRHPSHPGRATLRPHVPQPVLARRRRGPPESRRSA